jgi:hypothetical protein
MSNLGDPHDPPYHLVNHTSGRHIGPFSTYLDAAMARQIGYAGWERGEIMNRQEFETHLAQGSAAKGR